jgi:hypothetical protein
MTAIHPVEPSIPSQRLEPTLLGHSASHSERLFLPQTRHCLEPAWHAIRVAKILTSEFEEDMGDSGKDKGAQTLGAKGGAPRREKLSPERRIGIARQAAAKRWGHR